MRHTTHGNAHAAFTRPVQSEARRNAIHGPLVGKVNEAPINYRIIVGGPAFAMMLWGIGDVLRGVL